jgi:5,10-methylene-tetrahydrofolate dehydrogenase/methenyl tetrahydrofolate cyclohydrolase
MDQYNIFLINEELTKEEYEKLQKRLWRLNNANKIKQYRIKYNENNKEKIKNYQKIKKHECNACGFSCYNAHDYKRHITTKKHLSNIYQ